MGAGCEETHGVYDFVVCSTSVEGGVGSEGDEGRLIMITISISFFLGLMC